MKNLKHSLVAFATSALLVACAASTTSPTQMKENAMLTNQEKVVALIDSFNTSAQEPIGYINPNKYIQHNLAVGDGLAGFGAVVANAPPQGFSAKVHRVFSDGDYVVAHVEYDFFGPKAAFDIFRFEDGLIVEHWDNLTEITPPNPSGRTQFDGYKDVEDQSMTAKNKAIVKGFVNDILISGKMDKLTSYISPDKYIQHNSTIADGLDGLGKAFEYLAANDMVMQYTKNHKILGEGNFVLTVSEGRFGKTPGDKVAFYDLFRVEDGMIVEHWDVIQEIPPRSEWKNDNGKF